jgi:adenine phosphoribosyltransferase
MLQLVNHTAGAVASLFSSKASNCVWLFHKIRNHAKMAWFPECRDLGGIQTHNLLSRNQMRYSIAPRGLKANVQKRFPQPEVTAVCNGAQIYFFLTLWAKEPHSNSMDFKNYIRDIPDFPEKGITFKDITPLLKDGKALHETAEALYALVSEKEIDKVVGMESRGFFFAPLLAARLGAGFVPVRKDGKLPAHKIRETYFLEYGQDSLEIHSDSILPGEKVLIHDDVLATGGTAKAVCELVERLGGKVVQCLFLLELDTLHGIRKLNGYHVASLLHYA